jgi:hypothetical protein
MFRKIFVLILLLSFFSGCSFFLGEKTHEDIKVKIINDEIVFLMPKLPALGDILVEEYDSTSNAYNKWHLVWAIGFEEKHHSLDRIVYGKKPNISAVKILSKVMPLKIGFLYTVSMDIGSVSASGYFILQKVNGKILVENLTAKEAVEFQTLENKNTDKSIHKSNSL